MKVKMCLCWHYYIWVPVLLFGLTFKKYFFFILIREKNNKSVNGKVMINKSIVKCEVMLSKQV